MMEVGNSISAGIIEGGKERGVGSATWSANCRADEEGGIDYIAEYGGEIESELRRRGRRGEFPSRVKCRRRHNRY